MTAPTIQWAYLVPIIVVLGAGVVGVLVEAFVPAARRRQVHLPLALGATAAALGCIVWLWNKPEVHALTAVARGTTSDGGPTFIEAPFWRGASLVSGALVADPFGLAVQAVVVVLAFLGILVIADRTAGQDAFAPTAAAVPGSAYEELARRHGLVQTEVFPLVLFATGGMMLFPATSNLLVMFIALEVLSLPLYVLSAMARRRRLLSQEAGFKYFVLGAFSSALFAFGIALVYGYAGSVDLAPIFLAIMDNGTGVTGLDASLTPVLIAGLILILVGLLFKVGAAPFHMWTPDVYQGSPTPVTAFMAACTKAAAFGALLRVLYLVTIPMTESVRDTVNVALWIVAILTMIVGTVVAVAQTDIKRMLAYSSIAHAGFILVGIIGFAPGGFIEGLLQAAQTGGDAASVLDSVADAMHAPMQATVFYLAAYGLATLGAFAVVTLVRQTAPRRAAAADRSAALVAAGVAGSGSLPVAGAVGAQVADAEAAHPALADDGSPGADGPGADGPGADGSGADGPADNADGDSAPAVFLGEATHLTEWTGLGRRSPWLAAAFTLFLLSMAGIPLTAGFIAKFAAFSAAIAGGVWVLAVVGVAASAIAVFFYARIIVLMFFTAPVPGARVAIAPSRGLTVAAIALCALGVLVLGILPSWFLGFAGHAAFLTP